MYNLSEKVKERQGEAVTQEQLGRVQEVDEYLAKNKVHEVLNVPLRLFRRLLRS